MTICAHDGQMHAEASLYQRVVRLNDRSVLDRGYNRILYYRLYTDGSCC